MCQKCFEPLNEAFSSSTFDHNNNISTAEKTKENEEANPRVKLKINNL